MMNATILSALSVEHRAFVAGAVERLLASCETEEQFRTLLVALDEARVNAGADDLLVDVEIDN